MAEDRSLDDFAGAAADAADGESAETADDAERGPGESAGEETESADPAVATSTWHADGAECDRCGERVERRWREADALVCADCASW